MTDSTLLYKIAKAYYEDGQTQDQIGKRFGLSRIKISRLLNQARQSRVVQISITPPADSFGDLERDLERAYALDEVVVVSAHGESQAAVVPDLGAAAAGYLARSLAELEVVAISWGSTLLAIIENLTPQNLPDLRVVQMLGGLGSAEAETYGADLALRMATTLGARMRHFPSPGIVTSPVVREALLQDANVADTLQLAARANLAVVGIGTPAPNTVMRQAGILTDDEIADLTELGAVGDIALRFFDADGVTVDHPVNQRVLGLDLEQIKRIPRVVGVAGGAEKLAVIRAAAIGGLVNVLITDEGTARALLAVRHALPRQRATVA
ncbi:MAG: sugar-binding transcriptional regulator [Caldilineaceae bacterium]